MKKLSTYLLLAGVIIAVAFWAPKSESKIGHVDTEYILKKIPAYQDAQSELDNLAKQYHEEIKQKAKIVDSLYKVYQRESVLWPEDLKRQKEDEIVNKEKEIKELQKKYFAPDGLLAQKREELIKPIQDNLYQALKEVAEDGNYDYIFDKATGEILYAREQNDISDIVLKKMGY